MNPVKRRRSNRKIREAVLSQCGNIRRLSYEDQIANLNLIIAKFPHRVIAADHEDTRIYPCRDWCVDRMGSDGFEAGTNWITRGPAILVGTGRLGRFAIVPVFLLDNDGQYGYERVNGFFMKPNDAFEFKMRWG